MRLGLFLLAAEINFIGQIYAAGINFMDKYMHT
jgi:hypothetical protein